MAPRSPALRMLHERPPGTLLDRVIDRVAAAARARRAAREPHSW